ncbi:MAG TPA: hypothetical protein VK436_08600 [Methanocella sp.]|nr:hypothetical protein [Methanocella sp.]
MGTQPKKSEQNPGTWMRLADDEGVTAIIEYTMTFIFAFIIFTMTMAMFDGMFISGPTDAVSRIQFTDVGNDVSAKILDTYLIAPEMGHVSTLFEIPDTVAGKDYMLDVRSSQNGQDKEVVVYGDYTTVNTTVTINGVNSTIPINGNTSSMYPIHRIWYDSS